MCSNFRPPPAFRDLQPVMAHRTVAAGGGGAGRGGEGGEEWRRSGWVQAVWEAKDSRMVGPRSLSLK